jgi:hypothetical protein
VKGVEFSVAFSVDVDPSGQEQPGQVEQIFVLVIPAEE